MNENMWSLIQTFYLEEIWKHFNLDFQNLSYMIFWYGLFFKISNITIDKTWLYMNWWQFIPITNMERETTQIINHTLKLCVSESEKHRKWVHIKWIGNISTGLSIGYNTPILSIILASISDPQISLSFRVLMYFYHKIIIYMYIYTQFLSSSSHVDTAIWMLYMDAD